MTRHSTGAGGEVANPVPGVAGPMAVRGGKTVTSRRDPRDLGDLKDCLHGPKSSFPESGLVADADRNPAAAHLQSAASA
jgi:hypothetical protein